MNHGGAVLFDIDGTLVDSNDAHAHAWANAFAEAGIYVEFQKVRCAIEMSGDTPYDIEANPKAQSPKPKSQG